MNQLEGSGCEAMGRMLVQNQTLEVLTLSQNNMFDNGCQALFFGLESNTTLKSLDISVLKAGAVNTPSLLTLSLRHNYRLTRNSYAQLAEASKANHNILRIAADLQFEGWDEVWTKVEMILIRNTVYAMERYRVPLLMVARGRILLRDITHSTSANSTGIYSLPIELRRMILIALDKHNVLTRTQHISALNIACNPANHFSTKQELLAAVLANDYAFVHEMIKTVHS
ncbi:hypothetical protein IW143_002879 [Coemansia sp. RSA 520]|nr:hypothetical protein IW143_002879 [Coemansia sp. RSA 520]